MLVATIFFSCVVVAIAADSRYETAEQYVDQAKIIATVRMIERQPVEFEYRRKPSSCGNRYTAEIMEVFKGESGSEIEFYGPGEEHFIGLNEEYLVLIFERDIDEAKTILAPVIESQTGFDKARYLCTLEAATKFVRADPQTMIPFDRDAAAQLGGRWLRHRSITAVPLESFQQETVSLGNRSVIVTKWPEVEDWINETISKSP